jgi:hypothetical protein
MHIKSQHSRLKVIRQACEACPHRIAFDRHMSTIVLCGMRDSTNRRLSMVAGVCPDDRWDARDIYSEPTIKVDIEEQAEIKRLAAMLGRGCGKIAIIVATGPSRDEADLPRLRSALGERADWFSITQPDMRLWPTEFWVFSDDNVLSFKKRETSTRELWNQYKGTIVNPADVLSHKEGRVIIYRPRGGPFSRDLLRCGARVGRTTTHLCMQFVLWSGYEKAYLFGVDMDRDGCGKLYSWGSNPAVGDDARMARFDIEDANLSQSVATMTEAERSKFTFCSSRLKRKFSESFERLDHVAAVDEIIRRHAHAPAPDKTLPEVTLLTCTGARPEAFALCERYMGRQTYRGRIRWVVVDDGPEATKTTMDQTVIRREPFWKGRNTHKLQMLEALKHIHTPISFWIEDDDWYSPDWIEWCVNKLVESPIEMVGESRARYYNVAQRAWRRMPNLRWASACATAFRSSAIPTIERAVGDYHNFDIRFWQNTRKFHLSESTRVVGIKGMPGRAGAASGHNPKNYHHDPSLDILTQWIGPDAALYADFERQPGIGNPSEDGDGPGDAGGDRLPDHEDSAA